MSEKAPEHRKALDNFINDIESCVEAFGVEPVEELGITIFVNHNGTKAEMEVYATYRESEMSPKLLKHARFETSYNRFREEIYRRWIESIDSVFQGANIQYPQNELQVIKIYI